MYDVELCSSGKLRYIDIVGKNDNTIVILDDTTESEIPVHNAVNIATEVLLGWVLIGDDVIEAPTGSGASIISDNEFVLDKTWSSRNISKNLHTYRHIEFIATEEQDINSPIIQGITATTGELALFTAQLIPSENGEYFYQSGAGWIKTAAWFDYRANEAYYNESLFLRNTAFYALKGTEVGSLYVMNVDEPSYAFSKIGSTGGGSGTSLTDTITAGENLAAKDLVYLKSDGKYWKADYTTIATCTTELRLVTATILANATGESLSQGILAGFTGLTAGAEYFVGANSAVCLYAAIPDTEGIIVRKVGTAKSTTELEFNPDATWIKTTQSPTVQTGIVRLVETRAGATATLGAAAMTDYVENCTGTNTLTLPTAVGNTNKYTVTVISGATTVNTTSAQTINGSGSIVMSTAYLSYDFISNGSNWILR